MGSRRGRSRKEDGDAAICVDFVSASKYMGFGQSTVSALSPIKYLVDSLVQLKDTQSTQPKGAKAIVHCL